MEDQGIDLSGILARLFDYYISAIFDVIRRPGGLVSRRTSDRENQISILVVKNPKLAAFMLKTMECCLMPHNIYLVNSRSVVGYQQQLEIEQNKQTTLRCPK